MDESRDSIDTRITADMLKDMQWESAEVSAEQNSSLENKPVGKFREKPGVSVMPNLMFKDKENVVVKDDYLEYIDGAGVNVNVKFE